MKHPVAAAYVFADRSKRCPNCHAEPFSDCTHPDGTPRRIPCLPRLDKREDRYTADRPYDRNHGA